MQRDLFNDGKNDARNADDDNRQDEPRVERRKSTPEERAAYAARMQAREAAAQEKESRSHAHADQARVQGHEEKPHLGQGGNPNIIDAEVVEEVQAARPHAEEKRAQKNPHEKLILFAFLAILLGCILLLSGQTKALQSTNFAEAPQLNVPVIVRYAPVEAPRLTKDEEIQISFAEIVDNAAKLKKSMAKLSRPEVPDNKVLSMQDYNALKAYLGQKEGITEEADVRDILLQAGYTLPARLPDEQQTAKRNSKDHVEFARHVINQLLKDEVEDFLQKVQIVSEVGVYVADTAQEQ